MYMYIPRYQALDLLMQVYFYTVTGKIYATYIDYQPHSFSEAGRIGSVHPSVCLSVSQCSHG